MQSLNTHILNVMVILCVCISPFVCLLGVLFTQSVTVFYHALTCTFMCFIHMNVKQINKYRIIISLRGFSRFIVLYVFR